MRRELIVVDRSALVLDRSAIQRYFVANSMHLVTRALIKAVTGLGTSDRGAYRDTSSDRRAIHD